MCTVLLPPGDNPIAVNKYIIYHIISCSSTASTAGGEGGYVTGHDGDGIHSESDRYISETRAGERGS